MHMQLHQRQEASDFGCVSVRTCGMEANCELQHRTKVNSRKGGQTWVSTRGSVTPYFQSRSGGSESGGGRKSWAPYPVRAPRARKTVGWVVMPGRRLGIFLCIGHAGSRQPANPEVQSDRLVVAWKPINVGGAKGATS